MIDRRCAFLSPAGPLGGAYAIRPYRVTRKMIAFGVCFVALPQKQAAFRGCYGVGGGKCGAFSCPRVGRKSIRPTNVPQKEGEGPAFGRGQAFAIHEMVFCGAYAIRPYRDGRKMIAFGACSAVLPEKTGCLWGRLWGGRWKMWCVFMPLGRNYPAQKVRAICCFKKDATFAAVTTAVVDIFLK